MLTLFDYGRTNVNCVDVPIGKPATQALRDSLNMLVEMCDHTKAIYEEALDDYERDD